MRTFAILVLFTAFLQLQSKAVDPIEFKNLKQLTDISDQKLIAVYKAFYNLKDEAKLIGKDKLTTYNASSNYDGAWYKKHAHEITLSEPLSEKFVKWAGKTKIYTLVLQPVESEGKTVFEIIGYSKKVLRFPPKEELFPEFKKIDLINFDLPENAKELKKRKLVAGGLGAGREILEGNHPEEIDLHYSTNNFEKDGYGGVYVSFHKMQEDITKEQVEWLRVNQVNQIFLEKVKGTNKYRFVGYSQKSFFFQDLRLKTKE